MLEDTEAHAKLQELELENQRLLQENNELLQKLYRSAKWAFWLRITWMLLVLGVPFVVYYFLLEPYFASFGSSFEVFQEGLQEVPGWKQFYESM